MTYLVPLQPGLLPPGRSLCFPTVAIHPEGILLVASIS